MIKNIFLPEKIGDHFIFSQNYIGLEITKSMLLGAKINVSGNKATLYNFYQEPIIKNNHEENDENIITSIKNLIKKTGTSSIKLTIPNDILIFRELTLPFLDKEKINQILPYKLETEIPFQINSIAFDFISTKSNFEKKETTILVGIVQKKNLDYYLNILREAHAKVSNVTIDLFSIYGLYLIHPDYKTLTEAIALVDIGFHTSTISYIKDQQLLSNRSINQGLNTIAKDIASKIKTAPSEILEQIVRFGTATTENHLFNKALEEEIRNFAAQIQLTLNAFSAQMPNYETPKKILLLSRGTKIKELDHNLSQIFDSSVEYFDTHKLLLLHQLKTKGHINDMPIQNLASFGAAYPFTPTGDFNLLKIQEVDQEKTSLEHQLIASAVLIILFFGTLLGYNYVQKLHLRKKINNARRFALNQLKNELDVIENNLSVAIDTAKDKLTAIKDRWEGFSETSRHSYLKYLQELSTKIDRTGTGLNPKKLILYKKYITMIGSVRNADALRKLEEDLSGSKLFKLANIPQSENFEIKLAITTEDEESI